MNFYKKAYRYIATIIFGLGLLCLPFMKHIINGYEEVKLAVPELNWIYILFLLNTVITYLMAYKRTLIIADQHEYKITPIVVAFNIISTIAQIIVLMVFKNFILYLGIQIIVKVFENIFVNRYIDKNYEYIKEKNVEKLPQEKVKNLITNVKSVMLHKIGEVAVYSTDNLIITKFINLVTTGIYSNYTLLIGVFKNFTSILFGNLTASLGNLIVTENDEKKNEIFDVITFISFVIYNVTAVFIFTIAEPFVRFAYGEQYVLPLFTTILVVVDYFYHGIRVAISTVKSAAGLYEQDKYVPLATAILNIIISIVLANKLGLDGVILGTIISTACISIWYRPIIVYKNLLNRSSKPYFLNLLKYTLVFASSLSISWCLIHFVPITNMYLSLIYNLAIGIIVPCTIIFIMYRKTNEFHRIIDLIKNTLKRKGMIK